MFLVSLFLLVTLTLLAVTMTASANRPVRPTLYYKATALENFWARDINDFGEIAGGTPDGHAAVWHNGHIRVIDLGMTLSYSEAFSINNAGTALISAVTLSPYKALYFLAYRNGRIFPVNCPVGSLHEINDSNQIIGEVYNETEHSQRGFVWERGRIRFVTAPHTWCTMTAINNRGQALGFFWGNGPEIPFLVNRRDVTVFQTPDGEGRPEALNDFGQACGASNTESYKSHPAIWQPNGEMQLLESFGYEGHAMDLNNRGMVVGSIMTPGRSTTAIWINGQPIDLATMVDQPIRPMATGIHLNDRGEIICYAQLGDSYNFSYYLLQPHWK